MWKADNAVSLDLGAANLNYGETQNGTSLDTEQGWLPTIKLGFGLLGNSNAVLPGLYLHLDAGMSRGDTAYNGALCDFFGNCTPYRATTDDRIFTGALQAGRGFAIGDQLMLIPFLEIGYRYWERRLEGVGGYVEDYTNWDGIGGVLAQYSPAERWVASFSGAGGTTFGANMYTSGETFRLGAQPVWRVQGKLGYRFTEHFELTATAAYQSFAYGASAVDAQGYFEPNSTTQETTLLLGIAYHLF